MEQIQLDILELRENLKAVESHHSELLSGDVPGAVQRSVSGLRGRLRGLEFIISVFKNEQRLLENKVEMNGSCMHDLEKELSTLTSNRIELLSAEEKLLEELDFLRMRVSTKYPSSHQLDDMMKQNGIMEREAVDLGKSYHTLNESVEELRISLKCTQESLRYTTKELIKALSTLLAQQNNVCEYLATELSFTIEREEKLMRLRGLEREHMTLQAGSASSTTLSTISELTPLMDSEDIDARQAALSELHRRAKQAGEVHSALTSRVCVLKKSIEEKNNS